MEQNPSSEVQPVLKFLLLYKPNIYYNTHTSHHLILQWVT